MVATRLAVTPLAVIASIAILTAQPSVSYAQNGGDGQFLSTYLGPTTATDLLVTSSNVTYNATDQNFVFTSTFAGNVGTTIGGYYVWGVNKGNGAAGFASLGATKDESGVLFDSVIVAHPVADSITTSPRLSIGATTLPLADMSFTGNKLTLIIPAALLPSTGFTPDNYTVNLWPRFQGTFNSVNVTGNAQISQFAPNNSNFKVTAAPEPASLALLVAGGFLPALRRRRRTAR